MIKHDGRCRASEPRAVHAVRLPDAALRDDGGPGRCGRAGAADAQAPVHSGRVGVGAAGRLRGRRRGLCTAAAREVEEETGWRPRKTEFVMSSQPLIGNADYPLDLYLAHGAELVGEPEVDETAEVALGAGWRDAGDDRPGRDPGRDHDHRGAACPAAAGGRSRTSAVKSRTAGTSARWRRVRTPSLRAERAAATPTGCPSPLVHALLLVVSEVPGRCASPRPRGGGGRSCSFPRWSSGRRCGGRGRCRG